MHRTESEPRDTKLQSTRDADHTIRGVGSDGVFCCPECGAVLRLEQGNEIEGEGRTTLPGMPSSSSVVQSRDAEPPYVAHAQVQQDASTALAPERPGTAATSSSTISYLGPTALSSTAAYLGTSVFVNTTAPSAPVAPSTPVEYAPLPQSSEDPGALGLIDDPADLAPADTDEPTRVTRTNNLLPQVPVLPPPPPLVAEELARRASLGLPLPVLPPPPAASETVTEADGEVEDLEALLASQRSPQLSQQDAAAPVDPSSTSDAAERRMKHPLPVPHPVFASVPIRRSDASTTPLAGAAGVQIEGPTAPMPPVQANATAEAPATANLGVVQYPAPLPIVEPDPTQASNTLEPSTEAQQVPAAELSAEAPQVPAAERSAEARQVPAAVTESVTAPSSSVSVIPIGNRHAQPLFSDAPLTRDEVAIPHKRQRSSRALWLSLLVVGGGALVLQQRMKSPENTASTTSPVVSVVLAAQPMTQPEAKAAQPEAKLETPPASEQVPVTEESKPTKPLQAASKASSLTARVNSVREPLPASNAKLTPGSKPNSSDDEDEDSDKATTTEEPTFDADAAAEALQGAAESASSCRQASDPSGVAVVTITFAPSGRVTTANISGPPFVGTATGSCIAATLRRAKVPPFKGKLVTVRKTVTIR